MPSNRRVHQDFAQKNLKQKNPANDDAATGDARPGAFRFRHPHPRDLPHCVALLPPGLQLAPALRQRLPEIWTRLIASEACTFPVIDDL
jgi:hypothetical protein